MITGSASGIGLGIARYCVQKGVQVVLADVEQSALKQAEQQLVAEGGTVKSVFNGCLQSRSSRGTGAGDVKNLRFTSYLIMPVWPRVLRSGREQQNREG